MAIPGRLWPTRYPSGLRRWLVVGVWLLFLLATAATVDLVAGTPRASEIRSLAHLSRATTVYDVNGQSAFTIFTERRIEVPLSAISPNVIQAVLAIEDQRFYDHAGIDVWRIGGAMINNLRKRDRSQGGSTITQQLARKSFLTDDKTFRRKLKEMLLATRIERQFTKDQILELYLNKVYFGDGYYGIEAAATGYFGKSARDVSVEEAALLAGLIQLPSAYAPTSHLDRATARRNVVLRQMVAAGVLDRAAGTQLEKSKVSLVDGFGHEHTGQYFKNHIVRILVEKFGWETVSRGGLKVYATLDMKAQAAADAVLAKGLADAEKLPGFKHPRRGDPRTMRAGQAPDYLQGAIVALDPRTGEVRAMTGGRDFDESQFNRAVQADRQAGSAFKPFVYAAAIDSGLTPATLLTNLDDPMMLPDGAWLPEDAHLKSTVMTVRAGLRTSSNRAALQVLRSVGIPRAVSYAERMGLEAPAVPSLVLGAGDVTALSMASAYGVFANGGWLRPPVFIKRVEDSDGRVIYRDESKGRQALSEETSFLMAQMLADVINAGTGSRARQAGFTFPAAGKTGTTNDYRDAWFIGFTPTLVTSVWVGFDQPKTIMPGGYASALAVPIWGRFMQQAATTNGGWIRRPDGIVVTEICRLSGGLPTEGCRHAYSEDGMLSDKSYVGTEYFRRGTEPTSFCPIHVETGSLIDRMRSFLGTSRPAPPATRPILDAGIAPAVPAAPRPIPVPQVRPGPASTSAFPGAVSAAPPVVASPAKKPGLGSKLKGIFGRRPPPPPKTTGRGGGGH